jgi:hypothetical protein
MPPDGWLNNRKLEGKKKVLVVEVMWHDTLESATLGVLPRWIQELWMA